MPTVADLAEHSAIGAVGDEDVVERHLVEVVFAVHQLDRAYRDAPGVGRHDEPAEAGMAVLWIQRAGARQYDDLMRDVRTAGPHLGAVQQPSTVGRDRAHLHRGEVGARGVLAHPDRRVQGARDDARQQAVSLVVAAVGEEARCHLPIGDPVSGDGCAVSQQFLGHHVAVQVSEPVPAVLGGNGEADEPGVGQPDGEVGIPLGQPAVHRRHPAVCGAISGQEIADRRAQSGQFAVIGAQDLEFAHRGGSLVMSRRPTILGERDRSCSSHRPRHCAAARHGIETRTGDPLDWMRGN